MTRHITRRARRATTAIAAALALPLAAQAQDGDISFATTSSSSGWYSFFAGYASIINDETDIRNISVVETGGAGDSQRMTHAGQTPMGIANLLLAPHQIAGTGEWDGDANENIRLITVTMTSPNVLVVRADSGIASIEELDGATINPGGLGTATEDATVAVFEHLGIEPNWERAGMSDAADFVRDGRIDGFFKTAAGTDRPDSLIEEMQTGTDLRLISFTDEQAEAIREAGLAVTFDIPAGVYDGQDDPAIAKGLAYGILVDASEITDEEAYEIARVTFGEPEKLADVYPADMPDLLAETMEFGTVPLHAGVVAYLMEAGHDVPEALIPDDYEG